MQRVFGDGQGGTLSPPRTLDGQTLLFMLAALLFLYAFLFVPPFIPILYNGDGVFFIPPGQRMYQGEIVYRDFFEFVTPGTGLVYLVLFKVFGMRNWLPNLLSLVLGLVLAGLGVVIAKKLVRPDLALLPSAIFLVGVREFLCQPTHHWFSLLAATAAIASLIERRTPERIAAAGFFCGLAACFTQSRGLAVAVGFVVFLWWESRRRHENKRELLRKGVWLIATFVATLLAVNAYFIWKAGLARFLWCTVVFVLKYYDKMAGANTFDVLWFGFPGFAPARRLLNWFFRDWLFLHAVIPSAFVAFFADYWRGSHTQPAKSWERPMLVAIVGAFLLLSTVSAPASIRIAASSLPAIILLVWLIDSPRKLAHVIAAVSTGGVLLVALHAVTRRRPIPNWTLSTPQGKLVIGQLDYEEYTWVQEHTRPLEYFFEASNTDMYFRLNLRNPTPLPFVRNCGFTTREQVKEVIAGLENHHVRYILWSIEDLDPLPNGEDPADDHLGPLREYIRNNYQVVKAFSTPVSDEVWERRAR